VREVGREVEMGKEGERKKDSLFKYSDCHDDRPGID